MRRASWVSERPLTLFSTQPGVSYRRGVPADADTLTAIVMEGFESYRSFAPTAWTLPPPESERDELLAWLANEHVWFLVAEEDGTAVGHVAYLPALRTSQPGAEPALAHLWQLFVRREAQGTGIASQLLSAAVEAAASEGFATMRLFTPTDHARARRFYEREGWTAGADSIEGTRFGIALLEYRRALSGDP